MPKEQGEQLGEALDTERLREQLSSVLALAISVSEKAGVAVDIASQAQEDIAEAIRDSEDRLACIRARLASAGIVSSST